ncbi:MAG: class I SAM-dependent methyltransferase, partial [Hyphomicrobiaceae bacterium]
YFVAAELRFAAAPFVLLVAGCGTGSQAVSAALVYGPNARVVGLDISEASLAYAGTMARRMGVGNLELVLGDIDKLPGIEPSWRGRFKVIECCGVLHHMADPFGAWQRLLDCLAPDGLMLVGLYSAHARRHLETLRQDDNFPAPGCSLDELRAYREHLFARGAEAPGASYLRSRDAFTSSGFRDFFLHVSEKVTTLVEVDRFLADNGLRFRGFTSVGAAPFRRRFPTARPPGRLAQWAELEAEMPDLFLGMYQLWVSRI